MIVDVFAILLSFEKFFSLSEAVLSFFKSYAFILPWYCKY